jgi:eukaryotic-like serine/threonine-protein kinase
VPPRAVGHYEILSILGRGGIGTVYRARHSTTRQLAAVKLLGPAPMVDPVAARRLAREFETLRDLQHPNIVRVFEAGVAEGYSFLVMELIEGLDLRTYLSPSLEAPLKPVEEPLGPEAAPAIFDLEQLGREPHTEGLLAVDGGSLGGAREIRAFADVAGEPDTDPEAHHRFSASFEKTPAEGRTAEVPPPPSAELLRALNRPARLRRLGHALRQVCEALAFIHARGLVHRDLKPSNIMVDDRRRTYLMDFGLVKSMEDAGLTRSGRVVGTYLYMSPEQAQGLRVDGRSDLYSLGVILYELLGGRPPRRLHGRTRRWLDVFREAPPPVRSVNPNVEERLGAIADRLLRPDPEQRFQTAEEVLAALSHRW